MEEKKTRKIISASEAKAEKTRARKVVDPNEREVLEKEAAEAADYEPSKPPKSRSKRAASLRIGAVVLWVLAILFEVAAIYMLNIAETTFAIIAIVLDAICCIAGSLLWKKANRLVPCKSKSKLVCFIWNQMGVIACLLAFIPFGLFLLLKADKISPKMKKVIAAIAAVAFIGSVGTSIDYNPPTEESIAQAEAEAKAIDSDFDGIVYWTRWGKSYHLDPNCQSLTRSDTLISGTLEEAFEAKRNDPCDFCAGGGEAD